MSTAPSHSSRMQGLGTRKGLVPWPWLLPLRGILQASSAVLELLRYPASWTEHLPSSQALWSETAIECLLSLHSVNQSDKSIHTYIHPSIHPYIHTYIWLVYIHIYNTYLFYVLCSSRKPWLRQVLMHFKNSGMFPSRPGFTTGKIQRLKSCRHI